MSGPLPANLPASARIGLDGPDGRLPHELATLTSDEQERLARHALVHALLPLALEDQRSRQAFRARVNSAIVPDEAPFTRGVVSKLSPPPDTGTTVTRRVSTVRRSSRRTAVGRPASGRTRGSSTRPFTKRAGARRFLPHTLLMLAATAASVLIVFMLRSGDVQVHPTTPSAPTATIATLTNSESPTWVQPPTALTTGVRLRLARGLVELDLHGKGKLVLDGPADLELASDTRAVLRSGRLVLNVTPAGHGYRVETPGGTFTDLGTRFGVSVGAEGATEAHVLEGSIAAHATNSTKEVILTDNQAVRLQGGRLERIPADLGAFYTNLPSHAVQAPEQIHWRMDDGSGTRAHAEVRGFSITNADLTLKGIPGAPLPRWISGRQGGALAFDGKGGYAESDFPGIAGTQARTVTCWIRMPRNFTPADGFAIVSWGHPATTGRGEVWQVALNPLTGDGPIGRIRVGTHGGVLVGSSDLRDDRWHHVAVVMFGGVRPDIGTHVLVYIDGELEPISRRTLQTINTRILDDGHGVWVGRNVTHVDETRVTPHGFLRGAVDDLVITAASLTQSEIRALMDGR